MKQILFIISIFYRCMTIAQSPFLIEEEFDSGTAPSGWTFTSISSNSTQNLCGKSPNSLKFDATNDQIISPSFSNGDQITFLMICTNTADASDNMKLEVYNGSSWNTAANLKPHTTAVVYCINISTSVTKARLTYTKSSAGNVYVDDFTVRAYNSCTSSSNQPYITSINVDACSSGCEGRDEFFTFRNGNSTLNISDIEISYPNAGSSTSTWCGNSTTPCDKYITTNSSEVSSLNTLAGCNIFSSSTSIPANADVILFNGNAQDTRTNFSGLCASGKTYYAVFANNTNTSSSDGCNGRFGNSNTGCSDCYRGLFIRNRSNGCIDSVSYSQKLIANKDGAMAIYNVPNIATYPGTSLTNCNFSLLPLQLLTFYSISNQENISLHWEVIDDQDVKYYEIEKSNDGIYYNSIEKIQANQKKQKSVYVYHDIEPESSSYYKLKIVYISGEEEYSEAIYVIRNDEKQVKIIQTDEDIIIVNDNEKDQSRLTLINMMGEQLFSSDIKNESISIRKKDFSGQILNLIVYQNGKYYTRKITIL